MVFHGFPIIFQWVFLWLFDGVSMFFHCFFPLGFGCVGGFRMGFMVVRDWGCLAETAHETYDGIPDGSSKS